MREFPKCFAFLDINNNKTCIVRKQQAAENEPTNVYSAELNAIVLACKLVIDADVTKKPRLETATAKKTPTTERHGW